MTSIKATLSAALLFIIICQPPALKAWNPFGPRRILLTHVKKLTFDAGRWTSARQLRSVPQLNCFADDRKICFWHNITRVECHNNERWYGAPPIKRRDIPWKCENWHWRPLLCSSYRFGPSVIACEGWEWEEDENVVEGSCHYNFTIYHDPTITFRPTERSSWLPGPSGWNDWQILLAAWAILVALGALFWLIIYVFCRGGGGGGGQPE